MTQQFDNFGFPKNTIRKRIAHFFRERELILRSEGRVRYLRIRSWMQYCAAGFAFVMFAWGVGGTLSTQYHYNMVQEKDAEVTEMRYAYRQLQSELTTYRDSVVSLTARIEDQLGDGSTVPPAHKVEVEKEFRDGLNSIRSIAGQLDMALKRVSLDLRVPDAETGQVIASREVLYGEIAELRQDISKSLDREAVLDTRIKDLLDKVASIAADRKALRDERDRLVSTRNLLNGDIADRAIQIEGLQDRIAGLNDKLTLKTNRVSRLEDERQSLSARNSVLELALSTEKQTTASLRDDLQSLSDRYDTDQTKHKALASSFRNLTRELTDVRANLFSLQSQTRADEIALRSMIGTVNSLGREPGMESISSSTSRSTIASLGIAIANVSDDLIASRKRRADAEATIQEVLSGLQQVAGYRDDGDGLRSADIDPVVEAKLVLEEIKDLHSSQEQAVAAILTQTSDSITSAEKMMEIAGLDESLLSELGLHPPLDARGGPMEDLVLVGGTAGELQENVALLSEKTERWKALDEVLACIPWVPPIDYYQLTSKFGKRRDPINGKIAMHKGIDLAAWPKTKVLAPAPGIVTFAGRDSGYGKMIEIDHGCGITSRYAHLRTIKVEKGQEIKHRDTIGLVGSTGRSTGPHIHYEIRINDKPIDPLKIIEAGRFAVNG